MQGKLGEGNVPQVKEKKLVLRNATHIHKLKTERNCKYIKAMFYWGYARKCKLKLWLNFVNVYISKWICACLHLSYFSFFKFADMYAASYFLAARNIRDSHTIVCWKQFDIFFEERSIHIFSYICFVAVSRFLSFILTLRLNFLI